MAISLIEENQSADLFRCEPIDRYLISEKKTKSFFDLSFKGRTCSGLPRSRISHVVRGGSNQ